MSYTRLAFAGAIAVGTAGAVFGHADDPKVNNRMDPVFAPAYRSGEPTANLGTTFESNGITLLAWLPIPEFGDFSTGNDCWGYVSPTGREYAIIGFSGATAFVDITDPTTPVIVDVIDGPQSLWRDIKTYDTYAYAVSEGGGGIQVFDLSDIDSGTVNLIGSVTDGPGTSATHNVAIDTESGFLYRCGGTNEGLRIYDLSNPANPTYVASWSDRYVHDAQIVTMNTTWLGVPQPRQIAFCASGFNNGFVETGVDILDVTDKNNIELLSRYQYPTSPEYSHQCWLSEDGKTLYLNDELNEQNAGLSSTTHVLDVSDLFNPVEVNAVTDGNPANTHNQYVRGDRLFAANYRSGLRIFDLSDDPHTPVEERWFDTFPGSDSPTFNGLWSSYPFFPSGIVIGSDFERGLFIWFADDPQLTFEFPNGVPTLIDPGGDSFTVRIVSNAPSSLAPGTAELHYDLGNGFQSVPLTSIGNDLYEATFPPIDCPAEVSFFVSAESSIGLTWRGPEAGAADPLRATVAVSVETTFEDTFELDNGWTTSNLGATSGDWQRGTPVDDDNWEYDPSSDADGSGAAFVTQNELGNTDVDDGLVRLISPALELADGEATISFAYYLRLTDSNSTDELLVEVGSSEEGWTTLRSFDDDTASQWVVNSISVTDLELAGVNTDVPVQLRFTANDADPQSLVEAGVDAVRVEAITCERDLGFGGCVADCSPDNGDGTFGNGVVNVDDLFAVLNAFGSSVTGCDIAPDNGDGTFGNGVVNVDDLFAVVNAFGPCP